MRFDDVTRLALQPSVLGMDPAFARAQYVRDLDRTQARGLGMVQRTGQQERHDFDRALYARDAASPYTAIPAKDRRYHSPSGQATAPLLARLLRDAALQQYDAVAPSLREAQRAGAV